MIHRTAARAQPGIRSDSVMDESFASRHGFHKRHTWLVDRVYRFSEFCDPSDCGTLFEFVREPWNSAEPGKQHGIT